LHSLGAVVCYLYRKFIIQLFNIFSIALAMSPPSRTEAAGEKKCVGLVYFLAATRAGGRKNTKIYIIKRAKDVEREAQ
jgi:hypothetical protein